MREVLEYLVLPGVGSYPEDLTHENVGVLPPFSDLLKGDAHSAARIRGETSSFVSAFRAFFLAFSSSQ